MRICFGILFIALLSCNAATKSGGDNTDTPANVELIPKDSIDRKMPVEILDTNATEMPVVNPDTSKVEPK
jgi:hypothetical protein